ncbi:MAG: hypothetical protein ABI887_15490, partial [Burkholderiales bacterium]
MRGLQQVALTIVDFVVRRNGENLNVLLPSAWLGRWTGGRLCVAKQPIRVERQGPESTHNRHTPRRIERQKLAICPVDMPVVRFYSLEGGERSLSLVWRGAKRPLVAAISGRTQRASVANISTTLIG